MGRGLVFILCFMSTRDCIDLGRLLGGGAFGEVWEAEIPWKEESERNGDKRHKGNTLLVLDGEKGGDTKKGKPEEEKEKTDEKKREDEKERERDCPQETRKVAVKKIMMEKLLKEKSLDEVLKIHDNEIYLLLGVRHPNVVELVGMCSQTKPPWLLLELMDGVRFF